MAQHLEAVRRPPLADHARETARRRPSKAGVRATTTNLARQLQHSTTISACFSLETTLQAT